MKLWLKVVKKWMLNWKKFVKGKFIVNEVFIIVVVVRLDEFEDMMDNNEVFIVVFEEL